MDTRVSIPEPEDGYPWKAEVLPVSFQRGEAERGAHNAFEDLARVYGRARALELWREIAKEHGDGQEA